MEISLGCRCPAMVGITIIILCGIDTIGMCMRNDCISGWPIRHLDGGRKRVISAPAKETAPDSPVHLPKAMHYEISCPGSLDVDC